MIPLILFKFINTLSGIYILHNLIFPLFIQVSTLTYWYILLYIPMSYRGFQRTPITC